MIEQSHITALAKTAAADARATSLDSSFQRVHRGGGDEGRRG